VLLGLISVLFIGAADYKEGTDRAQCILTITGSGTPFISCQTVGLGHASTAGVAW